MSSTEELLKRLGVSIDTETLRLALTHRSYAYENGGIPTNERLEFLGDSILGFSVTDSLYRENPSLPEGELAKRRSAVVSTRALAGIGRQIGVGEFIYLGQGEKLTDGKNKASILLTPWKLIGGATYLSNDIETARQLVMRLVGPLLKDAGALGGRELTGRRASRNLRPAGSWAPFTMPSKVQGRTMPGRSRQF